MPVCLPLSHWRVSPAVNPVWTPYIKNSPSSQAVPHSPNHTHTLHGNSAPPTYLLTALSHQVHLCSSRLTKMTLRVRVQVYTSLPAFPLFSSRSVSAPRCSLLLISLSFPFFFLRFRSHSSFSLTCSEAPFSNSSLVHMWKCTEAGLGFWVHIDLSHPDCIFTRLLGQGDVIQLFTLLSGLGWSIRTEWSRSVMSDSLQPHGLYPTRLLCPCDFPGNSTGVWLPFPSPGDLPDPEIKPGFPTL